MGVEGVEYIEMGVRSWPDAVKFWGALGFTVTLDLGASGKVTAPDGGTTFFLEEIPLDDPLPEPRIWLRVDSTDYRPPAPAELVGDAFDDSHWGTKIAEVRGPDGTVVSLQHGSA